MRGSPAFGLLVALLTSSQLSAQAIRGHLIDDSNERAVGGATITLLLGEARRTQTLSDDDGFFFISLDAWGTYQLEATRIGYKATTSQPFLVEPSDTVTVEFRVLPDAVLLQPLLVTARSNRGRDVFYRRMESWDRGLFITPAMVDSIQPHHPASILRNQPKVWLSWGWDRDPWSGQAGMVPNIHTFFGKTGCVSYMIDGHPVRRSSFATGPAWLDFPLNTLRGEDIVAVEVYRHITEVPEEIRNHTEEVFNGQMPGNLPSLVAGGARVQRDFLPETCGIINFWTRVGW